MKINHWALLNCFIKTTCLRWLLKLNNLCIFIQFFILYIFVCEWGEFSNFFIILETWDKLWKDISNYSKLPKNGVWKLGKLKFCSIFKIPHPSIMSSAAWSVVDLLVVCYETGDVFVWLVNNCRMSFFWLIKIWCLEPISFNWSIGWSFGCQAEQKNAL